ncbi:hypothetical protein JCM3770_006257 [Rhodotorula araucariae]
MADSADVKPAPKKRGRKQDDSLPPSRSRDIQRAFRARRAALLTNLEARVLFLEAETAALRARCGLAPDAPPLSGPPPVLTAVETATGELEVPGGPGTFAPPPDAAAATAARGDGPPARKRTASAAPAGGAWDADCASRRSSAAAGGGGGGSQPSPSAPLGGHSGAVMDPQVGAAAEALLSGLAGAGVPRPPSAGSSAGAGGASQSPATQAFASPGAPGARPYHTLPSTLPPPSLFPPMQNGHRRAHFREPSQPLSPAAHGTAHFVPLSLPLPLPQPYHASYAPPAPPRPPAYNHPYHALTSPVGWPPLPPTATAYPQPSAHAFPPPSTPSYAPPQPQPQPQSQLHAFFPLGPPPPHPHPGTYAGRPTPLDALLHPLDLLQGHGAEAHAQAQAQAQRLRDAEKDLADLAAHQRAFLLRACGAPPPLPPPPLSASSSSSFPPGDGAARARATKWDAFCAVVVEGVLRAEAEGRVASLARRPSGERPLTCAARGGEREREREREGEDEGCCEGRVRCAAPALVPKEEDEEEDETPLAGDDAREDEDGVAAAAAADAECCGGLIDCSGPLFDDTPSFPSSAPSPSASAPAAQRGRGRRHQAPTYLALRDAFALLEPYMADPAPAPDPAAAGAPSPSPSQPPTSTDPGSVHPSQLAAMLWDGYPPGAPTPASASALGVGVGVGVGAGSAAAGGVAAGSGPLDPPHFAIAGAELRLWAPCVYRIADDVAVRALVVRGVCGEDEAVRRVRGGTSGGAGAGGSGSGEVEVEREGEGAVANRCGKGC